jgi:hypothetical protein
VLTAARAAVAELLPGAEVTAGSWQRAADGVGPLTCESVVTRIRPGTVGVHVDVGGAGTAALVARAAYEPAPERDFASREWTVLLADALRDNAEFRAGTGDFDGTIGLRAGDQGIELKVYRGTVLEASGRTPLGATFCLGADDLAWVELASAARNDYLPRSMRGDFAVSGNSYEYVRRTKAVVALWDSIRSLYRSRA